MSRVLVTCHVNAQSLPAHFCEFSDYFSRNFYDLIAISETWLNPSIPSSTVSLPDHTLLRHDRVGRTGGGVGLYVHNSLKAQIIDQSPPSDNPHLEFLFVEISFGSCRLLYAVVYRPPRVPFGPAFEASLYNYISLYPHIIISGDFNANFLSSSPDKLYLENLFFSLNLYVVPMSATHHTQFSDTWLDLFIIDKPENLICASQIPISFLSSHDLIQMSYNILLPTFLPKTITYRNLDSLTYDLIKPNLEAIDWNPVFLSSNIDEMVEILTSNLLSILDSHAPLKTSTLRRPPAPWLSPEIRALQKKRDAARRRFRRTRMPDDYNNFRALRNLVQSKIRSARSVHFHEALSSAPDPKSKWRILRNLSLLKSTNISRLPVSPDELNSHFASSPNPPCDPVLPLGPAFHPEHFYFSYISPSSLIDAVMKARTNAVGPDGIPVKFIKLCLPEILPVLLHIYNFSLQSSSFPTSWKKALVRPLPKVPNPTTPSDFRPISILSNLSKPLERLVQSQMSLFLENSRLLDPMQSGFRAGFSTQSALIKITNDLHTAIDQKKITVLLLLDFSKAFDTIDHSILYSKLESLSFSKSVILWFHSFLSGRSQVVSLPNKPLSLPLPLKSGVAQGSSVSPTLFSCYINDFSNSIHHCSHHLYADDSQIYLSFFPKDLSLSFSLIQKDLNRIYEWANQNNLKLNAGKTQAILIGSAPLLNSLPELPILTLNGQPIPFSPSVKNLGLFIDQTLSWKSHVSQISRRSIATLRLFRQSRHLLPILTRQLLVSSLIFPLFDYGCLVYGGVSAELEARLKRLMNCFIRFIFGTRRDSRVSGHYSELQWLYPSLRCQYFMGSFLFQIIQSRHPIYIFHLLQFKSSIHSLHTRSDPLDLYPPFHRSASFDRSFISRASSLWNSLPSSIRRAPSLSLFKSRLYQHLLSFQTESVS